MLPDCHLPPTNTPSSLTSVNGTIALQTSFLVAFSNLIPTHTVTLFRGILSLRVPRFPLLHILLITILTITRLLSSASLFLSTLGFLTSYTYLRFYKSQLPDLESSQPSTLRGDASEAFAFSEFFPDAAKPAVSQVSNAVYNLLVAFKICSPWQAQEGGNVNRAVQRGTPGSARAEAERRRALALKALDQRLNAAAGGGGKTSQTTVVQVQQPQTDGQEELGQTSYVPDKNDG